MTIDDIKKISPRYQPIILPSGEVIKKKCSSSITDSRKKIHKLHIPDDLTGKTVLDIGCSEGFFLREAISRGARHATGIEFQSHRAQVNRFVNHLWNYDEKIDVRYIDYMETEGAWDIVFCFSVIHHGIKNRDTWSALIKREGYEEAYSELIRRFRKIASLTNEQTIFEFPYTYRGTNSKRKEVDYHYLCEVLVKEGIYRSVEYKGLSDKMWFHNKDRCVYVAYR